MSELIGFRISRLRGVSRKPCTCFFKAVFKKTEARETCNSPRNVNVQLLLPFHLFCFKAPLLSHDKP
jgi:hypothetical protein